MNRWFEITVKAEIDNIENGKKKKVTEKYLVDALSYTEAESRSPTILILPLCKTRQNQDRWRSSRICTILSRL